jgi:copper transport protein
VRRLTRRAAGLLGALAVAGVALVAVAPAASAHAALLFTSPAADSAVPVAPKVLTLTFDESVTLAGPPVTLTNAKGSRVAVGPARQSSGRSVITVPVAGQLPAGVYTVTWQVISADGDPVSAQYEFAVGPAPASLSSAAASAQPSTPGQWPLAVARWFLFAGLAAALGGLAGRALAGLYRKAPPVPLPSPWALRGSLLGVAAGVVLAILQLGGGSLTAGLGDPSVPKLLSSTPGAVAFAEVVSFAVAAVLLRLRRPAWAAAALLAVVAAEGIRAHPESIVPVGGALLTWAHLLSVALWAGMLLYVVRAAIAWRAHPDAVRALVGLYSRAAAWLFALVVVTGVVSALVLVPLGSLFTTDYGRVLIVKAVLVAIAAALALAGRRWLRRPPGTGAGPALATRIEAGVLVLVLAVAGLLVAMPPPNEPVQALPFPPPASGPVAPLGGRAGEIGIYATASAGQIVLHLFTPGEDDGGPEAGQVTAALTLTGPGGHASALVTRGCGTGCVVAPARWARGSNLLTIKAAASGWTGGTTSLDVPWPPAPGAQLLRRITAAMRATATLTLREQVTSNTALGLGISDTAPITGKQFLASEPYETGVAPVAVQAPGANSQVRLLAGFPAQDIWADLTIGADGRIIAETLVDPDHLITRRFGYPDK